MHGDGGDRYGPETALLVVDVQNDFADPAGSLYVRDGGSVVPVANHEIAAAVDAGALVTFTQDWHPPSTPHFRKNGGIWPVHCVRDTWGAMFHPDLRVVGDIVHKGDQGGDGYSAFSERDPLSGETEPTTMQRLLEERGIERIVICGLATDYCVVETVADARALGYPVTVLLGGIRAVEREDGAGDRALLRMREAGAELV
jgi:nicotinamidase/pyrazinamidase